MSNEDGVYYTQDLISKVIALFAQIEIAEKEFNQKKADVLSNTINRPIYICRDCNRPMLPQQLWKKIPIPNRSRLYTRAGNKERCFNHLQKANQAAGYTRKQILSPEDLERLRKQVGLE